MKERNYGIDILKVVSMLFILILHINYQGGLIPNVDNPSTSNSIIMILEVMCMCAVNIYGLISGYLSYSSYDGNDKYKFKRLIYLWLQVVTYSLLISIVLMILGKYNLTIGGILKSFLPVSSLFCWYFTAYFLLFFFMPMINSFVKNTSNKFLLITLIPIVGFFSIYQSVRINSVDFTYLNRGYSIWWLFILFYIGAIISKTKLANNTSTKKLIVYLLGLYIISYAWKVCIPMFTKNEFLLNQENLLYEYISPTQILMAVVFLLIFIRIKINKPLLKKVLPMLSAATFGVYVMHMHPYIWDKIYNSFLFILDYNVYLIPLIVVFIAIIALTIMLIIDIIRSKIFSILKVDRLCVKIDTLINKILDFIVNTVDYSKKQ